MTKNEISELLLSANIACSCLTARKNLEYLHHHDFIGEELRKCISERIDKKEIENRVFITKPFRVLNSNQKDLYILMMSRIYALRRIMVKNEN
jgi:hypothetical protein